MGSIKNGITSISSNSTVLDRNSIIGNRNNIVNSMGSVYVRLLVNGSGPFITTLTNLTFFISSFLFSSYNYN